MKRTVPKKKCRKKQWPVLPLLLLLVICGSASGITYAYLYVDPGQAVNVITVGDIHIELEEEKWDPDNGAELHPKETAAKDPTVINTGKNPAYVFLETAVPVREFAVVGEDGKKENQTIQPICTFQADKEAWELLEERTEEGKRIQVYGYRELLEPGQRTTPLFTEIMAANYLEGSMDAAETFVIDITAKAIQSSHLQNVEALNEVYQIFMSQTGKKEAEVNES